MKTLFEFRVHGIEPEYHVILPLLSKHGIRAVTAAPAVLDAPAIAYEVAKRVQDAGLTWGTLPLSTNFYAEETGETAFRHALERLKRWMEVGNRIGLSAAYDFIPPGSNARAYDDQMDWMLNRIAQVAGIMNDGGLHYGFEFVGVQASREQYRYPFIHTFEEILRLNKIVGLNTGFVFDVYHWYCSGMKARDLELAVANIGSAVTLHLEDAISGLPPHLQTAGEREYPMATGIIPSDEVVRAFADAGYQGVVMGEPVGEPVARALQSGLESAVEHLALSYRRCCTEG